MKENSISNKYRTVIIRRDNYNGYEVAVKYIWFPFWSQFGGSNTFETKEEAREYAKLTANPEVL